MDLDRESAAVNLDVTALEGEGREAVEEQEVEEGEQESEEREQQAMETSVPTADHTYSTTVSSSQHTPVLIPSTITTSSVPPNLDPISDAMTDILHYALNMIPHPVSSQQATVETNRSVNPHLQSIGDPIPNVRCPFRRGRSRIPSKEIGRKQGKLGSALTIAKAENQHRKIVSVLEQSLREATGLALTETVRKQLHTDREKRLTLRSRKVILPNSFGLLSATSRMGNQAIAVVVSTVPSTTSANVAV